MGRRPCCAKVGLNKGTWSVMEDEILINYIKLHGEGKWTDLPHRAGLKRCGKSCRLRWMNYLRPNIKRGNISEDEEELIIRLHRLLGNRWALIAGRLPGRTDNEIKNYWNTYLSKRVQDRESQKFGKQTNNESGHGRFMGNRSTVAKATHEVIRTRAVRCIKAAFPQPVVMEQGHGVCSVPMSNDYPPSSSHWANNADDNFLLGFNIDELLVPDILMRSDSLVHQEIGIIEHKDTANAVYQIEDIVRCASPVPTRTSVGGEHFDPNCRTFDFDALPSF